MGHTRIVFVLVLLASATLGGCGRRGPLELPPGTPGAGAENTTAIADKQATTFNETAPPGVLQRPNEVVQTTTSAAQLSALPPSRPINAARPAKPSSFILDPLL